MASNVPVTLSPEKRIIVAADFYRGPVQTYHAQWMNDQVLGLARNLSNTGACLRLGMALRCCGYSIIPKIKAYGLNVCVDIGGCDVPEVLETEAMIIRDWGADMVMVSLPGMTRSSIDVLRKALPKEGGTELIGVVAPTMAGVGCYEILGSQTSVACHRLSTLAQEAGFDGVVCSGLEAQIAKRAFGDSNMTVTAAGVRPKWRPVKADNGHDALKCLSPTEAIKLGADRLLIGRPITLDVNPSIPPDPKMAFLMIIQEIREATAH